ncbi:sensor histidine kinase [Zooshikella harenae]|uniref:histidine kinase n=1 Tax=Zooshikella harenae TaxID=2827238 RepID=A0ABS5ZAM4_9GAMM|nr:sensor histidine kinase [Zooshikella harenae]MBU2711080.1 GHKL domain-containing protein [Zooshikella harenae]
MSLLLVFNAAMLITTLAGTVVGCWLCWGIKEPEHLALRPLGGFCLGMAIWCGSHVLLQHTNPAISQLGLLGLLANPFIPTTFLHFALLFIAPGDTPQKLQHRLHTPVAVLYLLALTVTFISFKTTNAAFPPWLVFPAFIMLDSAGWLNLFYTIVVGVVAHAILIWGWHISSANKRRSIVALFIAGGWGLVLASSFVLPSLEITWFPYPMLLLPSYVLLLVYGIVRYQLVVVNRWAVRAVFWLCILLALLLLITLFTTVADLFGAEPFTDIPLWELWLYSAFVLLIGSSLYRPAQRLAEKLIYPGAQLREQTLQNWLSELQSCGSWETLKQTASLLLEKHLSMPVYICFAPPNASTTLPTIYCQRYNEGWQLHLLHWENATPGTIHVAEMFGTLLASSCRGLQQQLHLAEQTQQRLKEQHLVELGALAAAMAHELRNPLNIIAMASTQCDQTTRQHIKIQIDRADHLITDMLCYAGPLTLQLEPLTLHPFCQSIAHYIEQRYQVPITIEVATNLTLNADRHRLQQVLTNLLENAAAFTRNVTHGQIHISALKTSKQTIQLSIHNNGPAIPGEIQQHLFQPFISKRQGGSGLGLAIVRRIMDAHHGQVWHTHDEHWPCSFICEFPLTTIDDNASRE